MKGRCAVSENSPRQVFLIRCVKNIAKNQKLKYSVYWNTRDGANTIHKGLTNKFFLSIIFEYYSFLDSNKNKLLQNNKAYRLSITSLKGWVTSEQIFSVNRKYTMLWKHHLNARKPLSSQQSRALKLNWQKCIGSRKLWNPTLSSAKLSVGNSEFDVVLQPSFLKSGKTPMHWYAVHTVTVRFIGNGKLLVNPYISSVH